MCCFLCDKERCKWAVLIMREARSLSSSSRFVSWWPPHEFIKCLKSPQRPVAPSWDAMLEDRGGLGGVGGCSGEMEEKGAGENYPEISDWNRNLPDSLSGLPFLKTSKAVWERSGGVFRSIQFRYLLCLAAGRLGIKLIKYVWSLYRSPLNGGLLRHAPMNNSSRRSWAAHKRSGRCGDGEIKWETGKKERWRDRGR